jgi:putative intracellular protease/amidase
MASGYGGRHLVAVVAFDGVVLGDLSIPCEVFGLAQSEDGFPLYEVRVCSLIPEVKAAHINLKAPWRLSSVSRADTVIVPGIAALDQPIPEALQRSLRRAVDRGARVASICMVPSSWRRQVRLTGFGRRLIGARHRNWRAVILRLTSILTFFTSTTEMC